MALFVVACVALALAAGWYGIRRRGVARTAGADRRRRAPRRGGRAADRQDPLLAVAIVAGLRAGARGGALGVPGACRPARARPAAAGRCCSTTRKSGGGKADRFDAARAGASRGIEPIELTPGADLEALVRRRSPTAPTGWRWPAATARRPSSRRSRPSTGSVRVCPGGTRNHFALDLGVDRDDVVGALDAFVDGGERVVDLADVNGRVFVNNVSLGLYAEAVQREGYRDAKLRTIMDTVPDALGPGRSGARPPLDRPGGHEHRSGAAILVSNNRYRLGRAVGSGTRPRIDDGLLGITVVGAPRGRGEDGGAAAAAVARVDGPGVRGPAADGPIAAGIDGEAVTLEAPLHFHIRPGVLRVRIAHDHPGASPSALEPEGLWDGVRVLARLAAGHEPRPLPPGGRALRVERD